ncbi:MAG: hypothetical protein F6K50_17835 [Moorea sp. SIO3I7]|uniref:hypothetical protein n=1 Tax=Moorena sp. SIO3I8 TaxID=2607833 RepID=UPI0013C14041|nr:hypothetical protein [Moorena sp. SIO3I8]NEN97315.1 hypothetical protein [Moorena sp. SIO3I7]NEO08398.1 hypothetical protein [Moorena sp. SIO3I8]
MDNSASQANNFQESGSPENSPLLSRLQRRQEKSGGVINTRQLHRHYQSTQATTARLTQRLTLPEQINSRYGASGLQPKLNLERFSRPRVESADVSNTYLEPTNVAPSNVALSGRGEGVQRSMATRTNSRQFPDHLGHQGRSQPPSRSVPSTSPKVPIISQIKSSTVSRSRACFQSFPQDLDPPQPPLIRGEPYSKSPERGIARSGDNGGSPSLKTRPSAQPPTSLPRQVKINRQATLSALHHQFTPPESIQSQVVPPKTEGDFHSPSPVNPASVIQTKLVVAKPTQPLATGKTSSTPDLVWRSQEEEESDSSLVQTKLSDSNPNQRISENFFDTEFCPPSPPILGGTRIQLAGKSPPKLGDLGGLDVANETSQTTSQDISLVQTKPVVVKPSQPLPTTTITPTKTTNLTKDKAINNSADNLVLRSHEEEESDSSLVQTKLSDYNPNHDISLVQTKSVVVKPSQPLPTTTTSPNRNINLYTETGKTSSTPDLVWRKTDNDSVAKVSKRQQLSNGVIARQPNLTGANSIPMTAPVTSTTATSNLPTTPADGVDIDIEAIAEHVSRILTRQLTMEQERRGIEKWH